MRGFLLFSLPVVIFFIIGDVTTTLVALEWGQEQLVEKNPFLLGIVTKPILFLFIKILTLPILYYLYKTSSLFMRNVYRAIPTLTGIALCINNLYFIFLSVLANI